MTWDETRARLEKTRAITPGLLGSDVVVSLADIRAALAEVEFQRGEVHVRDEALQILREQVEELEERIRRGWWDGATKEARAEVERLRSALGGVAVPAAVWRDLAAPEVK